MITSCLLVVLGILANCTGQDHQALAGRPAAISIRVDSMMAQLGGSAALEAPNAKSSPFVPPTKPEHSFYDRPAKIELTTWAIVGGADTGQSCHALATKPGWHENWAPSQSCAGLVAFAVGVVALVELSSYALHRHGHHRLERVPRLVGIGGNAAGLITSGRQGAFN